MDTYIANLADEELLIEFEVRNMTDKATREVTQTLKQALERKLEEERENSFLAPVRAHDAAYRQPRREIEACTKKLQQLRQAAIKDLTEKVAIPDWLPKFLAKLTHIKDRVGRISKTARFLELSTTLRNAVEECGIAASYLKSGKLPEGEALKLLQDCLVEMPEEKPDPVKKPELPKDREPEVPKVNPQVAGGSGSFDLEGLHGETLENDLSLILAKLHLNGKNSSDDPHEDHDTINSTKYPFLTDAKLRQEVKTWKIRFQGLRNDMTVQRFLSRVEWHAARSQIPCNQIVGALDLCLDDEALEWFWSSVDRNPGITWGQLKKNMIIRFAPSITDDDIVRMLNERKQRYPKETVQEFYQAIQKIALKASKPISDNSLYIIMRRNVRPGLQMALYNEPGFTTLAEFMHKCSSLEEMWKRFGHNPEGGLSLPNNTKPISEGYRFQPKRQVSFEYPRVHELEYPDEEQECFKDEPEYLPFEEPCWQEPQVSAVHYNPRVDEARSSLAKKNTDRYPPRPSNPAPPASRPFARGCWNCGSSFHSFMDCRRPIVIPFCFGCGAKNTFKADCGLCSPKENWRAETRKPREPHLERENHPKPVTTQTTEEAASNTDPELYRRWRQ